MATIYIDEDIGKDEPTQQGTQESPFKTLQFAYLQRPAEASYLTRKSQSEDEAAKEWKPVAKAGLKKAVNYYEQQKKKAAREQELTAQRAKEEAERAKVLEEAKKVVIEEDTSLPQAIKIKLDETGDHIKLRSGQDSENKGTRVKVLGRVHRERKQKDVLFITLRDGYGFMQVVIAGKLAKTYDALTLTRETSMEIYGEMFEVPAGAHAPLNRELHADFYRIPKEWKAAGGEDAITNRVQAKADPSTLLDLRHLTLRGEVASSVMLVRDAIEYAFHTAYKETRIRKVSPPALVQTQVEGGATLFKFDYYGQDAFLTQSSQLYLETVLPSMGDVYCIEKSFRAEKSLTRRHLSEYTHIEAELDFITFDDLLTHLEHIICRVLELTMADPVIAGYIKNLNPDFKMPERPFMRMKYSDAIQWLVEHEIPNEEGEPHKFGDDIAEAAERRMTDIINRPIFLTHFPVEIKAFYMQRDKEDPRVTESVDCLMPGVGEIVGGSMRLDDHDALMAAFKREGLNPEPYYWYTDQRKYGSSPHGGYGLGLERFLAWLCKQHTVRDCCLYPRYMGRCTP
ncbi:Aspartyl/Asparaginyl-tRNA synthetase class IIb [Lasiodiplodia theobromae]|uniref:asparagine--tRNA ligase n=2 Tax=Lasiodiplodia TaxID=66739 RepID=A0A5N5D3V8_9PEZI|nr:Aspartyl/Asparaginyl-tRNA synthetase class IIb [Lasiodiplodia theobromae]KAB2572082.1 putative asparagine--tRNA ligase [Lasiodiplodia theobromae]KAF4536172.1 Aspartyl/Asparaginyl-tRNA synthetase class IIb [Lasiodiplodia theobromae]KAF9634294.1 Aspartyl/Asparaginyl-tRNA synthetase class IIb [Lasiodiplodia theobromae]KAK0644827.1 putative asparagine--tRNA ligase [Lasiodiplodia hormozganensis]